MPSPLLNVVLSTGLVLLAVVLTTVLRAAGSFDESIGLSEALLLYAAMLTALNTGSLLSRGKSC